MKRIRIRRPKALRLIKGSNPMSLSLKEIRLAKLKYKRDEIYLHIERLSYGVFGEDSHTYKATINSNGSTIEWLYDKYYELEKKILAI